MAKKAYIGVDGVAHKVKKIYVGADSKARKVKKAYIGVGGVARPCFSSNGLDYFGVITPLQNMRWGCVAGQSNKDYAVFAGGGDYYGNATSAVDAYDKELVRTTATPLKAPMYKLGHATVGDYAVFSGTRFVGDTGEAWTHAYNLKLTMVGIRRDINGYSLAGANASGKIVFAGGMMDSTTFLRSAYAYDASLTQFSASSMKAARAEAAASPVNGKALICGGYNRTSGNVYEYPTIAEAYTSSLTKSNPVSISVGRSYLGYAKAGDCMVIAGGRNGANFSGDADVVEAIDANFTLHVAQPLPSKTAFTAGTGLGGYAIFAGGISGEAINRVVSYDESLTQIVEEPLTFARRGAGAATIGNFALFASGYNMDSVEAYTTML